jgi:hypothetical protein
MLDDRNVHLCNASLWRKAFLETLAIVTLCVLVIGARFLPTELERLRDKPEKYACFCAVDPERSGVFSLVASVDQPRVGDAHGRCIQWIGLSDKPAVPPVACPTQDVQCFAFDAHDRRLFMGEFGGKISVADPKFSGRPCTALGRVPKGNVQRMDCSQDGKTLVTLDRYCIMAWNIDRSSQAYGAPRWCQVDHAIDCFGLFPDSSSGVYVSRSDGQCQFVQFDALRGEPRPIFQKVASGCCRLAVSPNGRWLAASHESGKLTLLHRTTDTWELCVIDELRFASQVMGFSPHSNCLAVGDRASRKLLVWDLEQGRAIHTFAGFPRELLGCCFLDQEQILLWSLDNTLHVANLSPPYPSREIEL